MPKLTTITYNFMVYELKSIFKPFSNVADCEMFSQGSKNCFFRHPLFPDYKIEYDVFI